MCHRFCRISNSFFPFMRHPTRFCRFMALLSRKIGDAMRHPTRHHASPKIDCVTAFMHATIYPWTTHRPRAPYNTRYIHTPRMPWGSPLLDRGGVVVELYIHDIDSGACFRATLVFVAHFTTADPQGTQACELYA